MSRIDPRWLEDEEIQRQLLAGRVRRGLIITALIWTPPFLICAALLLFFGFDVLVNDGDRGGTWFLVVVLAVVSFLFGSQCIQSLLDLARGVQEMTGEVTRRWARSDSLVLRSHYIRIGKQILRGDRLALEPYQEGDRVRVVYYPNSAVVVEIRRLPPPEEEPAEE